MHLALLLLQTNSDNATAGLFAAGFMGLMFIACVIGAVIVIIPLWFICKKAGFSPFLSLLSLVPLGVLILLYVLAFAEWKPTPPAITTLPAPLV